MRHGLLLIALVSAACGHAKLKDGVIFTGGTAFRVGELPPKWHHVHGVGVVTYHHDDGGSISLDARCERVEGLSLDVLTNHLLLGIHHRAELDRTEFVVDGRAALRTDVEVWVDGVPLKLCLVVVKRGVCVYDLELIASPADEGARRADFDRMVDGFHWVEARR
jgi:hypothetical protein